MHNAALELFNDCLLHFSDDLHFGVRIAAKELAISAKYIQFNQPHAVFWLGFDVDRNAPVPAHADQPRQRTDASVARAKNLYSHRTGRNNEAAALHRRGEYAT